MRSCSDSAPVTDTNPHISSLSPLHPHPLPFYLLKKLHALRANRLKLVKMQEQIDEIRNKIAEEQRLNALYEEDIKQDARNIHDLMHDVKTTIAIVGKKFDEFDTGLNKMDTRLTHMETIFARMEIRFDEILIRNNNSRLQFRSQLIKHVPLYDDSQKLLPAPGGFPMAVVTFWHLQDEENWPQLVDLLLYYDLQDDVIRQCKHSEPTSWDFAQIPQRCTGLGPNSLNDLCIAVVMDAWIALIVLGNHLGVNCQALSSRSWEFNLLSDKPVLTRPCNLNLISIRRLQAKIEKARKAGESHDTKTRLCMEEVARKLGIPEQAYQLDPNAFPDGKIPGQSQQYGGYEADSEEGYNDEDDGDLTETEMGCSRPFRYEGDDEEGLSLSEREERLANEILKVLREDPEVKAHLAKREQEQLLECDRAEAALATKHALAEASSAQDDKEPKREDEQNQSCTLSRRPTVIRRRLT